MLVYGDGNALELQRQVALIHFSYEPGIPVSRS
jgi:hypothetical protein